MINKKTVFILGAGASADYGFPIGTKLRDTICKNLVGPNSNTNDIAKVFKSHKRDDIDWYEKNVVINFRDRFYKSSEFTIDAFIENNNNVFGAVAKLAIAQVIASCEDDNELHKNPDSNWYMHLFQRIKTQPSSELHKNEISFLTFNYDLSLDQFLYNSVLHATTTMNESSAKSILQKIPIIHLYGQLGDLAWQGDQGGRVYGQKRLTVEQLKEISKSIKTVFDPFDDNNPQFKIAYDLINKAENIFFIGFGFDERNLKRLNIPLMKGKNIIATALGLPRGVDGKVKECFKDQADTQISLVDCDALKFIKETNIS